MKSFSTVSVIFAGLASIPSVLAHGRVESISIAGNLFKGPAANDFKTPSTIRTINSIEPVTKVDSPDMECGAGAAKVKAQLTADAKAGDELVFDWVNGNGDHPWPHKLGPMLTYLANCGGDCAQFDSAGAQWFKIDEAGVDPKTGVWAQEDTLFKGKPYATKLPQGLPDGDYLMRHEVIGLHNAGSLNGAEYYPACMQIKVSGGSKAASKLPASDFVQFPGAYSAADPGLRIDVFSPPFKGDEASYVFPGPKVVSFSSAGGNKGGDTNGDENANDDDSGSSASSSSALPRATASATKSASPSTITPAPAPTDADSGDDNSDEEIVETVTVFETVTANPKRPVKTVTVTETVEAGEAQAATITVTASATATGYSGEGGYRRRRRIMGRRHH